MTRLFCLLGILATLLIPGSVRAADDKKALPSAKPQVDPEALFKKLDTDGDGKLSLDEFKKLEDLSKSPADAKRRLTPEMLEKIKQRRLGDKKPLSDDKKQELLKRLKDNPDLRQKLKDRKAGDK